MNANRNPTRHFFLSVYGWTFWLPILLAGTIATAVLAILPGMWPGAVVVAIVTLAAAAFFRDFHRPIPTDPGLMVAPADGKVTEITHLAHHPVLGTPAVRIGIFLSVLDVHVNRSPCDAVVLATQYVEGLFLDARHTESGLKNQSNTLILGDPANPQAPPIAIVKQIVGAIARRIIAPVGAGDHLARGQRFGMIAFGSRTELVLPNPDRFDIAVSVGQHVKAGVTIMARQRS